MKNTRLAVILLDLMLIFMTAVLGTMKTIASLMGFHLLNFGIITRI